MTNSTNQNSTIRPTILHPKWLEKLIKIKFALWLASLVFVLSGFGGVYFLLQSRWEAEKVWERQEVLRGFVEEFEKVRIERERLSEACEDKHWMKMDSNNDEKYVVCSDGKRLWVKKLPE